MTSSPAELLTFSDGEALGTMIPSDPVEKKVENTSTTVTLPWPPGVGVGVTRPSVPVEATTAVEKMVVIPPSPVVVAGTSEGPSIPPPPPMVIVLSPEMIVV